MIPKCEHIYYLASLPQIIILVLLLTVKMSAKVKDWGGKKTEETSRKESPTGLRAERKKFNSGYFKNFGQNCYLFFLSFMVIFLK